MVSIYSISIIVAYIILLGLCMSIFMIIRTIDKHCSTNSADSFVKARSGPKLGTTVAKLIRPLASLDDPPLSACQYTLLFILSESCEACRELSTKITLIRNCPPCVKIYFYVESGETMSVPRTNLLDVIRRSGFPALSVTRAFLDESKITQFPMMIVLKNTVVVGKYIATPRLLLQLLAEPNEFIY